MTTDLGTPPADKQGPEDVLPDETPEETVVKPTHFSARLGGEISNHPGLKRFEDETALAKSYLELEKTLSSQGPRVPRPDAGKDEIRKYHEAIGVPESVDGYAWNENVTVPEDIGWDENFQNSMLEVMHKAGLTREQVKAVGQAYVDAQAEVVSASVVDAKAARQEAEKLLRKEWGSAFDANVRGATLAMQHLFGDEFNKVARMQINGVMVGNHPLFLKAFALVGKDYEEHNVHGMAERRRFTKTPQEAADELAKLDGDKEFQAALWQKDHPGHAAAVQRRNDLYAMKSGGGED